MPRVTKAELTAALEESKNLTRNLQEELRVEKEDLRVEKITSLELQARLKSLEEENEDLKKRVRRGCDRSRSPRRPAATVEADLAVTSRALHQVSRWQESAVVRDQKDEIQRLQAEVASLRRGEGPLGEVLAYNDSLTIANINHQRTPQVAARFAEAFAQQKMPVNVAIQKMKKSMEEASDFLRWGREP
jgi:hypothetical protein